MADRSALGVIGLMLCAATMLVVLAGAIVVGEHLSGRLHIEDGLRVATLSLAAR